MLLLNQAGQSMPNAAKNVTVSRVAVVSLVVLRLPVVRLFRLMILHHYFV